MTLITLVKSRGGLAILFLLSALGASPALPQDPIVQAAVPVSAEPTEDEVQALAARRRTVEEEQANVARERRELAALRTQTARQLEALDIGQIVRTTVEQAELAAETARVNLSGVEVELQTAEQKLADLQALIESLQERLEAFSMSPTDNPEAQQTIAKIGEDLALQQAYLALEDQHLANLQAARFIAGQRLGIALKWAEELRNQYQMARELSDKAALGQLQERIQKEQQALLDQVADLRKRLDAAQGTAPEAQVERGKLKTRLLETEEQARLKQIELALAQAQARLNSIEAVLSNSAAGTDELAVTLKQADALVQELAARAEFLKNKIALIKQQQGAYVKSLSVASPERKQAIQDSRVLAEVLDSLGKQSRQLAFLTETTLDRRARLQTRYEQKLRHGLMIRQTLPADMPAWRSLGQEFLALPVALGQTTFKQLVAALHASTGFGLVQTVLIELVWLGLIVWIYRYLKPGVGQIFPAHHIFLGRVMRIGARLLRANIISVAVIGALFILFLLAGMPQPGFGIFILFALAWLSYKLAIDLAQMLLLDGQFTQGVAHPRLYRALRWGALALALLTPLMLLGHFSAASPLLRNFTDRLFLLLLIPGLILILRGRKLILLPLHSKVTARWLNIGERVIVVLSLALLISAVVGLVGYVNLAWAIVLYVGLFLLVLGGWLLLRGLLRDLVRLFKNRLASRTYGVAGRHTFLENIMDPLGRIAQLGLFIGAMATLFHLYGWDAGSPVTRNVREVLTTQLLSVDGRPITILNILLTLLIVIAVVRVGGWSRELTYRWLFYKVTNSGARHSLSVFTQYAVVLIGFLIALRVLGINLTTLTVFAGALGVGIGFGLQNIANNFVSGILLLIERPVRTGDTVTIGPNQGSVTRIGIRSLTVQTPDNLEVIIPNADVISHPFTNWTFSDTVVRTSLAIAIGYQNDLHLARRIIEGILKNHASIIRATTSSVWLEDFGNATVVFRVHYFTDLCTSSSGEVKSALLFQIWDSFKQAGIRFPGAPVEPPAPAQYTAGQTSGEVRIVPPDTL
ncbi:MAG: mechanosensitive ion channel domain-containing protein [Gammaproteobacteria bacterium]